MNKNVIQLSISIADRLAHSVDFLNLPEAGEMKKGNRGTCPGCANRWRSRVRLMVPDILERIVKTGNVSLLYTILSGIYGKKDIYFRLPGRSKIVFNREGIYNVRTGN